MPWKGHKITNVPIFRILVVDSSRPLETMRKVYKALAKRIFSMVPMESMGGNVMQFTV